MAGENGVGMLTGVESSSTIEAPATGQMNVQARVYYESDRERRNIACGVEAGVTSKGRGSEGRPIANTAYLSKRQIGAEMPNLEACYAHGDCVPRAVVQAAIGLWSDVVGSA